MINRKLKVGDKLRCVKEHSDFEIGFELKISGIDSQCIHFYCGECEQIYNDFPFDRFELIEESPEQTPSSQENILTKADKIRKGVRDCDYGDAVESFKKIATIASIRSNKELTPLDCVNVLMSVKDVRESYKHKEDNLVDLAGYADIKNLIMESEK